MKGIFKWALILGGVCSAYILREPIVQFLERNSWWIFISLGCMCVQGLLHEIRRNARRSRERIAELEATIKELRVSFNFDLYQLRYSLQDKRSRLRTDITNELHSALLLTEGWVREELAKLKHRREMHESADVERPSLVRLG